MYETRWRRLSRRRAWLVLPAAAVLTASIVGLAGRSTTEAAPGGGGGEVHGYVQSDLGQDERTTGIYLPDITVYLRNLATADESPRVTTDRKGFFVVPRQAAGDYELCVEAPGYVSACPRKLTIGSRMVFLPPVKIVPKSGALTGRVLLEDGSPCGFDDPAFGVSFDTWVEVATLGGAGVTPPVRANAAGEYLVPAVPAGSFRAVATCEGANGQDTFSINGGWRSVDLALDNRPPKARFAVASLAGVGVRRVPPGSQVGVTVTAADGDPLHYRWVVSGAGAPFVSRDADTVDWTLPDALGIHTIYALVLDGRGGVDLARLDLDTGTAALFTGTVVGTDGDAVAEARVEVNGAVGETDAAGAFAVAIEGDTERFVLTIQKQGFQILSEVLDAPLAGGRYELVRAQRFVFDADAGGTLIEQRRESEVPGAQVLIPAGALVGPDGAPAAGPVDGYVSSIDLRDPGDRFPGEYAGIDAGGREVALNSLGAVDVQLFDAAGRPLNLAPGRTAMVRIGIDPLQLGMPEMPASPPPTVPIWFYDPKTGVWNQEGSAVRAGAFYETAVPHFSVINADLEFTNPACVRVVTDEDLLTLPYQLRISVPAVSPVKVMTETVADALSVVVRLPAFTPIKLEVLDGAGNPIAVSTQVHITGASSSPDFPPYPYSSCTTEVDITWAEPTSGNLLQYYGLNTPEQADDYYSRIDPTATLGIGTVSSAGTTVTGSGTSFIGFIEPGHILRVGTQVRLVDAVTSNTSLTTESPFSPALPAGSLFQRVGTKPTLAAWKSANGFGVPDQEAAYLNAGDLGLGRYMRMKKSGSNVAFYVSNHGTPPNNGSVDLAAIAMVTGPPEIGLIATVAMEYSPDPGGISPLPYTKFYVYDNSLTQKRINKADLDGNGPKYLPNLCVICHGTSPVMDVRGDVGARFIPFDLESFKYSSLFAATSKAAQQSELKEMNRVIRDDTNVSTSIQELIEGWYGGTALPNPTQAAAFVPPGWTSAGMSSLYSDVVKPSCRSCHTTRDPVLDWAAWDPGPAGFKQHPGMYPRVCGPNRIMPHAVVTYRNFWRSFPVHQPNELANAMGWSPFLSTPCPNP